jgi:hypothetical protein
LVILPFIPSHSDGTYKNYVKFRERKYESWLWAQNQPTGLNNSVEITFYFVWQFHDRIWTKCILMGTILIFKGVYYVSDNFVCSLKIDSFIILTATGHDAADIY